MFKYFRSLSQIKNLFLITIILLIILLPGCRKSYTRSKIDKRKKMAEESVDSFLRALKDLDYEKTLKYSHFSYKSKLPASSYDFAKELNKSFQKNGQLIKWEINKVTIKEESNQALVEVNLITSLDFRPLIFDLRYEDKMYKIAGWKVRSSKENKLIPDYSPEPPKFHK